MMKVRMKGIFMKTNFRSWRMHSGDRGLAESTVLRHDITEIKPNNGSDQ